MAKPNPSIEVYGVPINFEDQLIGIISADANIISSQVSEEALYFQLASVEEATTIISLYNNIDIANSW